MVGRAARPKGILPVAEAIFALDFSFVRVEHVERVVARGLPDDEHQAASEIESVAPLADGIVAVTVHGFERQAVDV